ncbi:hypothetical protein DEO72_LG10g1601 [Vigna unguiculata]|uniref:Uncharacterized protein n=1 Tax=Vigna unguiculata TaxID=3917 RepID=A0A4D6NBV9_VIGUN|nr:hypothetical protein DEO72_LG10g1601 [Vigna unguiculata]
MGVVSLGSNLIGSAGVAGLDRLLTLTRCSRPSVSRLDAFSKSFKHFKDGYFKVIVKEGGKAYFLNTDGSPKFPLSWTNNPSRYKDMGMDELSVGDKEVGETLLNVSRLDAFSKSFKHFKDGYFKVIVKEGGKAYFLNTDGSPKFPSSWTNNPSRYKDMGMDELSVGDKEVVETLLKFVDKLPTKGLVRVHNSVHPIIDIEGHMAQSGKKNLALFQTLRKEMAAKAKATGKTDVRNLQESVVEVHVHGGTKRKAELPPRLGKGKDVKKVRAALLGTGHYRKLY